jgi:hypothetical protein
MPVGIGEHLSASWPGRRRANPRSPDRPKWLGRQTRLRPSLQRKIDHARGRPGETSGLALPPVAFVPKLGAPVISSRHHCHMQHPFAEPGITLRLHGEPTCNLGGERRASMLRRSSATLSCTATRSTAIFWRPRASSRDLQAGRLSRRLPPRGDSRPGPASSMRQPPRGRAGRVAGCQYGCPALVKNCDRSAGRSARQITRRCVLCAPGTAAQATAPSKVTKHPPCATASASN